MGVETVARTLFGEARGQSLLDQLGVLAVIRERAMRPGWWGRTWEGVCRHPWQFSCWHTHDDAHRRNYDAMMAAHEAAPHTWDGLVQLVRYAYEYMGDGDVMQLFGVDSPDSFPTHYFSAPLTEPPKAWGDNITEIVPPWESHFRWYVVRDGRPPRRLAA